MNIIQKKWLFLNATQVYIPKQVKKLYLFGLQALALRKVESLRANARLLPLKWATAKSKAWRLTKNSQLLQNFPQLLTKLSLVTPADIIAVDFSGFGNGFQVLLFAKQTKKGRTVPLYFEIIRYPIKKSSQNIFIIQAIRNFTNLIGCQPILVMDRGFACPSIIRFLSSNHQLFYIRIKKEKKLMATKNRYSFLAKNTRKNDRAVLAYESCSLRLIVSDQLPQIKEPWYIITNDFSSSRGEIIERYYHRFEIEEFFRDAKRLLGLETVFFQKKTSLSLVLWFVILGLWCLWHIEGLLQGLHERERRKMELSIVRYLFEKLSAASLFLAEQEFLVNPG